MTFSPSSSSPILSDRELMLLTYQTVQQISQRMDRIEERLAHGDRTFEELRQADVALRHAMEDGRRAATTAALSSAQVADAAAKKAQAAYDLADELRDTLQIDGGDGKRVMLREVVVSELARLRRLQAQVAAVLALGALVWPVAVEAIRRWLFP